MSTDEIEQGRCAAGQNLIDENRTLPGYLPVYSVVVSACTWLERHTTDDASPVGSPSYG